MLEDQPTDVSQMVKLKTFYKSCMDISSIKTRGYGPAVKFIQNIFGPYLNPDNSDDGDLTDVIYGKIKNIFTNHNIASRLLMSDGLL